MCIFAEADWEGFSEFFESTGEVPMVAPEAIKIAESLPPVRP